MEKIGDTTPDLDRFIEAMSPEDKVGQLLMVSPAEKIMRHTHAGTVIFMDTLPDDIDEARGRVEEVQRLNAETSAIPLWIHGFVFRPPWAGPGDPEIAKQYTPAEAEELCVELGRRWRDIGLHTYPGPTVNVPMFDTCIGQGCAISRDPETVVRYARAIARGLTRARCGTMAQHFPAHGATPVDSHIDIPVIELGRDELMRDHIRPYQAAFEAGCTTICTAHLRCPALDPDPDNIATTSKPILTDFLRGELDFRGVTIADCVSMQGFQKMGDPRETTIKAVAAGCDSICITPWDDTAANIFDALLGATQIGALTETRLDEAVQRNLTFKHWLGILPPHPA